MKYINMVNLTPARDKYPSELSGGMRQRTSLARSLAMEPNVLLLDEPLGALDALTRAVLQDEILRIWEADRRTMVLITNDVDEGILMADRIIPLTAGPRATLGSAISIDIPRPRDRKSLNKQEVFQRARREVVQYLVESNSKAKDLTQSEPLQLPDLLPEDLSLTARFWHPPRRRADLERARQDRLDELARIDAEVRAEQEKERGVA